MVDCLQKLQEVGDDQKVHTFISVSLFRQSTNATKAASLPKLDWNVFMPPFLLDCKLPPQEPWGPDP